MRAEFSRRCERNLCDYTCTEMIARATVIKIDKNWSKRLQHLRSASSVPERIDARKFHRLAKNADAVVYNETTPGTRTSPCEPSFRKISSVEGTAVSGTGSSPIKLPPSFLELPPSPRIHEYILLLLTREKLGSGTWFPTKNRSTSPFGIQRFRRNSLPIFSLFVCLFCE